MKKFFIAVALAVSLCMAGIIAASGIHLFKIVTNGTIGPSGSSTYGVLDFSGPYKPIEGRFSIWGYLEGRGSGVTVEIEYSSDNSNWITHPIPIISGLTPGTAKLNHFAWGSSITDIPLANYIRIKATESITGSAVTALDLILTVQ